MKESKTIQAMDQIDHTITTHFDHVILYSKSDCVMAPWKEHRANYTKGTTILGYAKDKAKSNIENDPKVFRDSSFDPQGDTSWIPIYPKIYDIGITEENNDDKLIQKTLHKYLSYNMARHHTNPYNRAIKLIESLQDREIFYYHDDNEWLLNKHFSINKLEFNVFVSGRLAKLIYSSITKYCKVNIGKDTTRFDNTCYIYGFDQTKESHYQMKAYYPHKRDGIESNEPVLKIELTFRNRFFSNHNIHTPALRNPYEALKRYAIKEFTYLLNKIATPRIKAMLAFSLNLTNPSIPEIATALLDPAIGMENLSKYVSHDIKPLIDITA